MREENKDVEKFLCVVIERGIIAGQNFTGQTSI